MSPNFPLNYEGPTRGMASKTCNWYVNVRPNHKILLNFEFFAVEGDPTCKYIILKENKLKLVDRFFKNTILN